MDSSVFRQYFSNKYVSYRFIIVFVIAASFLFSFYLYSQLDQSLSSRLDLKYGFPIKQFSYKTYRIHDQCSNNRRSNWKWGYAGDINREERRIRDSLVAELNDIASKRDAAQVLHQQLVTNNSKLEETVHELELLVKELKLKKKEYSDLRNVHLSLPHEPLLSSRKQEDPHDIDQSFSLFEEAIDYRLGFSLLFELTV